MYSLTLIYSCPGCFIFGHTHKENMDYEARANVVIFIGSLVCVGGGRGACTTFQYIFYFKLLYSVHCTVCAYLLLSSLRQLLRVLSFVDSFLTFAQLNLVLGPTTLSLASFVMYYKFFC